MDNVTAISSYLPDWAEEAGLTYRKLDYWTRQGWLRPLQEYAGSGFPRRWPESERAIAQLMARLVDAGLVPAVAASIARRAVAVPGPKAVVPLGDGLHLVVEL